MQNAGLQYGEGVTPVQESPFVTAPVQNSSTNSTSSLRQFRKKDNVDKGAGAGGALSASNQDTANSSHVARVAPHNHYPHKQNEYFRYPPQYQEYGTQYKEPTVKYSEIADPVIQAIPHLDHLPPSVLTKHKEKEYVDMCNIPQQSHINKPYPDHQFNGQQSYPPDMSMHHQYMQKDPQGSQMHSPYKPESQYIPKEGAFNHQIPPFLKYNIPQSRNYGPLENSSLTPFQRMDPHLARSFMTEHHHIREFPTEYSPMEQSRMYAQKQRYYPTPLPPSNSTYPPNYPHRNVPAQQYNYPSCNYPRSAQMNATMGRYAMSMERSVSPRRTYTENMEIGMGFPQVPQKIQGYPNYPAYAQHYQQRRPPAVPQDYYHPQQHPHPRAHAQYMPNHHAQEMTENHVASNNIRQYLENWAEEEATPEIPDPKYISRLNRDETNEVYVINASELPQYLENGVPLIASENGQYIFKSNVSIDNTGAIKILDKTGEASVLPPDAQDRVVSLHIIENPKGGDCLVNGNRPVANQENQAATVENNAQRPYQQVYNQNRMTVPAHQNGEASINLTLQNSTRAVSRTPEKAPETSYHHEVPQNIVIPSAQTRLNFDESLLPNPVPCDAKQKKNDEANAAMISNVMNEEAILKEAHEELDKIVQDTLTSNNLHIPMENQEDYLNLDLEANPKDSEENEAIIDLSTTSRRTSKSENEEQDKKEETGKNEDDAATIKHMPLIFDGFEEHAFQKSENEGEKRNEIEEKKEETKEEEIRGNEESKSENSGTSPDSPKKPFEDQGSILKKEETPKIVQSTDESKPERKNNSERCDQDVKEELPAEEAKEVPPPKERKEEDEETLLPEEPKEEIAEVFSLPEEIESSVSKIPDSEEKPVEDEEEEESKMETSEDTILEIPKSGIKRKRIFSVDDIIYRIGSNQAQICEGKERQTEIAPGQDNEESVEKNEDTERIEENKTEIQCPNEDNKTNSSDPELSKLETKPREESKDEEIIEENEEKISEPSSCNESDDSKPESKEEQKEAPRVDEEMEKIEIPAVEVEIPKEEISSGEMEKEDISEEKLEGKAPREGETEEKSEIPCFEVSEVEKTDDREEEKEESNELQNACDMLKEPPNKEDLPTSEKKSKDCQEDETKENTEIAPPTFPEEEFVEKEEIDKECEEKEKGEVSEDSHPEQAENLKRCLPETSPLEKEPDEAKTEDSNKRMKLDTCENSEEAEMEKTTNEDEKKLDFETSERPCRFSVIQRIEPSQKEDILPKEFTKKEDSTTKMELIETKEENLEVKISHGEKRPKKKPEEEITFEQRFVEPLLKKEAQPGEEQVEEKPPPEDLQYRSVLKIEENVVLLDICGELVEISVNQINGKKVITVVPISSSATVDINDNYEHVDRLNPLETCQNEMEIPEMFQETCVDNLEETDRPPLLTKTGSSSEEEENTLRNEEITSTQPESLDIFEDIILNENEIIIGDESLEEEINLDLKNDESEIEQKPILCTKAAKKLYDDDQTEPATPKTHTSLREFRKVKTKPEPPASPLQDKRPKGSSRQKGAFQELIKQRKMRKEKIRLKYSKYVLENVGGEDKAQGADAKEVRSEVRKVPKLGEETGKVGKNQVCSAVRKVKGGDGSKKKDADAHAPKTKGKEKDRRRSVDESGTRINLLSSVIVKEPSSNTNLDKKKTEEKPTSTSQILPDASTPQNFHGASNDPEPAKSPHVQEKQSKFPKMSAPRDLSLTKHANEHYLSRKDHSNLKKKLSIQEYNSRKRKIEESKVVPPPAPQKAPRVEEYKGCEDGRNNAKPSTIYSGKQFERIANCVKDPRRLQFMNSGGLLRCNSEESSTCRTPSISPFRSPSSGTASNQSDSLLNRISIDNYKTAISDMKETKTMDKKYESSETTRRKVSFDDNVQINEVHTTQTKTFKIRQDSNSSYCEVTSSCSDSFEPKDFYCEDKNEGTNSKYQNIVRIQKSEIIHNDWEDSNSPKDCITDAFADCFLDKSKMETMKGTVKNKLIIDINDFDTSLIDNELKNSYQNSSKSSSCEDGLKNYKEEVDIKLNSLNIQIPKTTKNNRVPNEDDILMHKFLRKEQLSSEEIKQIRRIIYFKKKMQQLQISQQNVKTTEDNYEIKKTVENSPNKDLKLQLKKVEGRVKKKKKRFRNLYSDSPETSENELQETAGEFSVYGGENISGVKLIFKRKTDFLNLQPVVKLQRVAHIDSMAKKLRFE